jgi:hypothetical protein
LLLDEDMKLLVGVALVGVVGCAQTSTPAPSGVSYSEMTDAVVAGTFHTQYGDVGFRSEVVADGVAEVTFDRGNGVVLGSHVDWTSLENDLRAPDHYVVTSDDRLLLKALSTTLETDLANSSEAPAIDNLIRQANLWGHHPELEVTQRTIVADPERSWTKLCNVNAYTFKHDARTHGMQSEYLAAGRYETSNPCRDRCGTGCNAVGTSAWTADCGNHDRCEQLHPSADCMDEFASASDDFTFAGNCSY